MKTLKEELQHLVKEYQNLNLKHITETYKKVKDIVITSAEFGQTSCTMKKLETITVDKELLLKAILMFEEKHPDISVKYFYNPPSEEYGGGEVNSNEIIKELEEKNNPILKYYLVVIDWSE